MNQEADLIGGALSNPDVFPLGQWDTFVPLQECASWILLIQYDMSDMLIIAVALNDTDTVICRAVIQYDEFKVLIGLL